MNKITYLVVIIINFNDKYEFRIEYKPYYILKWYFTLLEIFK